MTSTFLAATALLKVILMVDSAAAVWKMVRRVKDRALGTAQASNDLAASAHSMSGDDLTLGVDLVSVNNEW